MQTEFATYSDATEDNEMAKKPTKAQEQRTKIENQAKVLMVDWFNANQDKNAAATRERNANKELEALFVDNGVKESVVHRVGDRQFLEAAIVAVESEEIDPRSLFEKDPEMFWKLVKVPKTEAIKQMGELAVAKVSRVVTTEAFKITKHKTDPRSE